LDRLDRQHEVYESTGAEKLNGLFQSGADIVASLVGRIGQDRGRSAAGRFQFSPFLPLAGKPTRPLSNQSRRRAAIAAMQRHRPLALAGSTSAPGHEETVADVALDDRCLGQSGHWRSGDLESRDGAKIDAQP